MCGRFDCHGWPVILTRALTPLADGRVLFTAFLGLLLIRADLSFANASAGGDFALQANQSFLFAFEQPGSYSQSGTLEPGTSYFLEWNSEVSADASTIGPSQEYAAYASFVNFTLGTPVQNSTIDRSATASAGGIPGQPSPNLGQTDQLFSPAFNFNQAPFISGGGQVAYTISNVSASFTLSQGLPLVFNAQGALQVATSSNGDNIGASGFASYVFTWGFTVKTPTPYTVSSIIPVMATSITTAPPSTGSGSGPPPISMQFTNVTSGDYFDPQLANGYVFQMSGGSHFTQILNFPTGFASKFNVIANGVDLGAFGPGDEVNFSNLLGTGVSSFEITGIVPGVDPTSSVAFPIQLAFDSATASFSMTPVPEPSSTQLLCLSFLALALYRVARPNTNHLPAAN